MLRRIGYCRKRMMSLLRLLVGKVDVVKTLVKRGETKPEGDTRPALSNEVSLYLGDVQGMYIHLVSSNHSFISLLIIFFLIDHILTMLQALNHYEKISSRSHSNYLAQISIEMTQTNNEMNDVLSKLTALGSVLVPMNLVTGLWGMNVLVPGQHQVSSTIQLKSLGEAESRLSLFAGRPDMVYEHYRFNPYLLHTILFIDEVLPYPVDLYSTLVYNVCFYSRVDIMKKYSVFFTWLC